MKSTLRLQKMLFLSLFYLQKWTSLSEVQHVLSAVGKQRRKYHIFHFLNKTSFSHYLLNVRQT